MPYQVERGVQEPLTAWLSPHGRHEKRHRLLRRMSAPWTSQTPMPLSRGAEIRTLGVHLRSLAGLPDPVTSQGVLKMSLLLQLTFPVLVPVPLHCHP